MTDPLEATTLHVRRAIGGDHASIGWIVEHFSPLLLLQARYRLGRTLRGRYDPEDLVQQVWAICLPRLGRIIPREGRYTPVLLKYLGSTLVRHYGNLVEKHLAGRAVAPGEGEDILEDVPAETTAVLSRVMRNEELSRVTASIAALDEREREIIVLRGIERLPYKIIARRLAGGEEALRARYSRALKRLKGILAAGVSSELAES